MNQLPDPFIHHPELRGRIIPHQESAFRNLSIEGLIEQFPEMAALRDWA